MSAYSMEDCNKNMNKIRGSSRIRGRNRTSKTLSKNGESRSFLFCTQF